LEKKNNFHQIYQHHSSQEEWLFFPYFKYRVI